MSKPAEERITDLEIKLCYQDELIRKLDDCVIELRAEVERLTRQITLHEGQLRAGVAEGPTDERPPHYAGPAGDGR